MIQILKKCIAENVLLYYLKAFSSVLDTKILVFTLNEKGSEIHKITLKITA